MKKRILALFLSITIILNITTISMATQQTCNICKPLFEDCLCIPVANRVSAGQFVFGFNEAGDRLIFANGSTPITVKEEGFLIAFDSYSWHIEGFHIKIEGLTLSNARIRNSNFLGTILYTPSDNILLMAGGVEFTDNAPIAIEANQPIFSFDVTGIGSVSLKGTIYSGFMYEVSEPASVDITLSNAPRGHVLGKSTISIGDALAVLKHLAGITTLKGSSFEAALITPQSQSSRRVSIGDVLEILKHLAGIKKISN
jgi:hypothetical protein